MTLDEAVIQQLSVDRANLRRRYDVSEETQWGLHAYGRRALVIYADRAAEAMLHQTPENLEKARAALEHAQGVFDSIDKFVAGKCTLAKIGDHVMPLEDSYLKDFPQSRLAAEIRSGRYLL